MTKAVIAIAVLVAAFIAWGWTVATVNYGMDGDALMRQVLPGIW